MSYFLLLHHLSNIFQILTLKFLQHNPSTKRVSSIKCPIPQTTSSPSIHPTPIKESVEDVNQPKEVDKNRSHDSTDKDQTSETSSSATDSKDENQAYMHYASQDKTLEQKDPKDIYPPGIPDQGKGAHKNPEMTNSSANTEQLTAKPIPSPNNYLSQEELVGMKKTNPLAYHKLMMSTRGSLTDTCSSSSIVFGGNTSTETLNGVLQQLKAKLD